MTTCRGETIQGGEMAGQWLLVFKSTTFSGLEATQNNPAAKADKLCCC